MRALTRCGRLRAALSVLALAWSSAAWAATDGSSDVVADAAASRATSADDVSVVDEVTVT
jgi:hypothetical protein